jgi:hypothetical protein
VSSKNHPATSESSIANPYECPVVVKDVGSGNNRKAGGAVLGAIHGLAWSLPFSFLIALFVYNHDLAMQNYLAKGKPSSSVFFVSSPLLNAFSAGAQISIGWSFCAAMVRGVKDRRFSLYAASDPKERSDVFV